MKKKHFLESIVLFVIGSISSGMLNYFLQKEPLWKSIMQGVFLGIVLSIIYLVMVMFWGYLYDEHYPSKFLIIVENIVSVTMLWYSMITFTTDNKGISSEYEWLHIVFIFFATLTVFQANREGKKIRKLYEKSS